MSTTTTETTLPHAKNYHQSMMSAPRTDSTCADCEPTLMKLGAGVSG